MMRLSLRWQIVTLLLAVLAAAQLATLYLLVGEKLFIDRAQQVDNAAYQFVTLANLLDTTPGYLHEEILLSNSDGRAQFRLSDSRQLISDLDARLSAEISARFFAYLDKMDYGLGNPTIALSDDRSGAADRGFFGHDASVEWLEIEAQMPSGDYLSARFGLTRISLSLQGRLLGVMLLSLALIAVTGIVISANITRPLAALTRASADFGAGKSVPVLAETGPADIRQAIAAFNEMNVRLLEAMRAQKQMLTAIGHDLRSPLTSLRLRAETLPDSSARAKIIATLDEMAEMVNTILQYAVTQAGDDMAGAAPAQTPLAIDALVSSLVEDYQETGRACHLESAPPSPVRIIGHDISLRRALRNVIDNGLHYGSRVTIDLGVEADWVDIILRDNGPGIDAAHIGDAVQPFFTSDKARSRNKAGAGIGKGIGTGIGKGIGMGLAITNAIITAHHGTLELTNTGSGLQVRLRLPLAPADKA